MLETAEQKAAQIEPYPTERIRSIAAVSHTTSLVSACEHLTAAMKKYGASSPAYSQAEATHRAIMTYIAGAYGYPDMLIAAPDGTILFSLQRRLPECASLTHGELAATDLTDDFDR